MTVPLAQPFEPFPKCFIWNFLGWLWFRDFWFSRLSNLEVMQFYIEHMVLVFQPLVFILQSTNPVPRVIWRTASARRNSHRGRRCLCLMAPSVKGLSLFTQVKKLMGCPNQRSCGMVEPLFHNLPYREALQQPPIYQNHMIHNIHNSFQHVNASPETMFLLL